MSTILEQAPIFSIQCVEGENIIERNVYPMLLTPDNVKKFWEKAKDFKVLFWNNIDGDFHKFLEVLISQDGEHLSANGLFWVIDDMVGIFYMTHIQQYDAQIHYTFFDKRHNGRLDLTRAMIKYVFKQYRFNRLSAEIPCFLGHTIQFIEKVGMVFEGRKRNAVVRDDKLIDVKCYGILKEEAESWA